MSKMTGHHQTNNAEQHSIQSDIEMRSTNSAADFDPNSLEIARLRRKLDYRLMPLLSTLYLFSFLDRVNIGNAYVGGLAKDLQLSPSQFSLALTIFFVGYIVSEIPSNMMLKTLGPRKWITLIMFTWGTIMACMAKVDTVGALWVARFFLGVAEAGLLPGVVFVLSCYYTRSELALRNGMFFSMATLAGAFGGTLAYGIMHLDGRAGLFGWQWLFLIEGLLTIVVCVISYIFLPDFLETCTFLDETERSLAIRRLRHDAGSEQEVVFSWAEARLAFTDLRVWFYIVGYGMGAICLFSLSLFMPAIVQSFHFDPVTTQLMTERGLHIAFSEVIATIGYIMLITLHESSAMVRYVALTITCCGVFGAVAPMLSWFSGNIGGHTKRSVAIALIVAIGSIGGVIGSNIYRAVDAPLYLRGHKICACLAAITSLISLTQKYTLNRENCRRKNLSAEQFVKEAEGENLCDSHPSFRYIS